MIWNSALFDFFHLVLCCVSMCVGVLAIELSMEFKDFDDNDISWLTQEPKLESQKTNFKLLNNFQGDSDDDGLFCFDGGAGMFNSGTIVSLEGNGIVKSDVLYVNVVAEDISSDEEINKM